ncbi:MAG: C40 family peptidase [Bacteroidetes bacterium]|nr:C40 family peptidase [Bacteroidota bacterium]
MKGIICKSIVPVWSEPSWRSEMVTQLLFGESYEIMDEKDGWLLVSGTADHYEGWINGGMSSLIDTSYYEKMISKDAFKVDEIVAKATNLKDNTTIHLVKGSLLPLLNEGIVDLGSNTFQFHGSYSAFPKQPDISKLESEALSYLNAPYLWGGRSPFGIDCSGFVQMVYRNCGINLPRDARQQVELGDIISFISETVKGDLAFFENTAGTIIHVGILLGDNKIIHASGSVRIDAIDHQGIFNRELGKYTHQLRIIKRLS